MSSDITYDDGRETYNESSPYNEYDYHLQTPMRTTFSGAYVIGKKGLLSVDYELVNYGNAKLKNGGDGYDFYDENAEVSETYKTSGNLRIGGELMATKNISLRAGYEYHGTAYNDVAFGTSQLNSDANMMVYGGGIGYRTGLFFADLAYRYSTLKNYDYPYPIPYDEIYPVPQSASFNNIRNDVLFTIGFKF
jgi:long-subunit fatty acid transport protein